MTTNQLMVGKAISAPDRTSTRVQSWLGNLRPARREGRRHSRQASQTINSTFPSHAFPANKKRLSCLYTAGSSIISQTRHELETSFYPPPPPPPHPKNKRPTWPSPSLPRTDVGRTPTHHDRYRQHHSVQSVLYCNVTENGFGEKKEIRVLEDSRLNSHAKSEHTRTRASLHRYHYVYGTICHNVLVATATNSRPSSLLYNQLPLL